MKVQHQQKQQRPKSQTKDGEMLTSRLFQLMSDIHSCVVNIWIIALQPTA